MGKSFTRDLLYYTRAYFDVGCCNIFIAVESNERFLHPTNGPTSTLLWAMSHQIMCLDTQMSLATAQPGAIHWSVTWSYNYARAISKEMVELTLFSAMKTWLGRRSAGG